MRANNLRTLNLKLNRNENRTLIAKPEETKNQPHKLLIPATVFVSVCLCSTLALAAYTRDVYPEKHPPFGHHVNNRKIDRSAFFEQLKDPHTMRAFAGRMRSEVGGQGRNSYIAWAETTFNRAAARKQTLLRVVTGNYFPTHDPGSSNNKEFHDVIREVAYQGTNITNGATGNGSSMVGFGNGPARRLKDGSIWAPGQTAAYGGERFGLEAPDKNWKPKYIDNSGSGLPVVASKEHLTHLALLRNPTMEYLQEKTEEHLIHKASIPPPKILTPADREPQVVGKYPYGLHPVIKESMLLASRHLPLGYKIRFDNASRNSSSVGGYSYHLQHDKLGALAVDIEIIDPKGRHLKNLQSPATFAMYRDFMHWTKKYQYDKFPAWRGKGRWGGYFVSGVAADLMHYDLGPEHGTQAGKWETGLSRQFAHFGKPHDVGRGMGHIASFQLPNPFAAMAEIPMAIAGLADKTVTAGMNRIHHSAVQTSPMRTASITKKKHRPHRMVRIVRDYDDDDFDDD